MLKIHSKKGQKSISPKMKAFNFSNPNKLLLLLSIALLCVSSNMAFASKQIKFSVDLSLLVSQNKFNPATDVVYIRGTFNDWGTTTPLLAAGNNVFSVTMPLADDRWYEYKYFINTSGAENGGWETNFPITSSGNRRIYIGINDLTLPPVFYNDGEMDKVKTTSHFNIYYTANDNPYIEDFASRIEICYTNISKAIQSFPSAKTSIYLYKDLDQLHMVCGYPENGPGSIGSAWGSSLITMLGPFASDLDGALGLFNHEYTHCLIASKTKVTLPGWLNEGVASYYGQNFSTKDWIKSEMLKQGKPNIADVFNGYMGYAYSSIVAYYIIKTKGEEAMAKFIENMNYADIGYANLEALQADWWKFLDVYLDYQTTVNVKLSVDMADMISANYFKPGTDKVFVNLHRNIYDWYSTQMKPESGTVYSVTVPLNRYNFFDYKFSTNSPTAPNGGYELKVDETTSGTRLLDVENSDKTLPVVKFNSNAVPGLYMTAINNKINALKVNGLPYTTPSFSAFQYSFKSLTNPEFEAQKPADLLPFDCGFVSADGTINISEPTTDEQKAVFKDINQVAVYYLCQSYMYFFYQTKGLPLLFKVGFPAYESGLNITDADIKTAIANYGGSFASFDVLNNSATFVANNGIGVAMAFAEFMKVFKNWGFPLVLSISANAFDVASWWYNTDNLTGLLDDFNRYLYARFLEPNENFRIKIVEETGNFRFYTRPVDAAVNFPKVSNALEDAYKEYNTNYGIKAYEKLTVFTLADCAGAVIEGVSCNPETVNIGGTANPHGLQFGCTSKSERVNDVVSLGRHELAHTFQGLLPVGPGTQWLGEGFAFFSDGGPLRADFSDPVYGEAYWRKTGITSLEQGTKFFGHRPTYEDTKVYPGYETDYGYKYLGYFLNDFIYRKGGYAAVKDVQMNDLAGYKKMGYSSGQAFMDDFYYDFDVRVQNIPMVTLKTPEADKEFTTSPVSISWTSLKDDVKLSVLVSKDNKTSWAEVASKTTQTSSTWDAGTYTGKFFLKFVAPDNLNLEAVFGPFYLTDPTSVSLKFPNGGECLVAGDTTRIQWDYTNVPKIKLEYSENNGTSWNTIETSINSSATFYKWLVPAKAASQYKVRISDASNAAKSDFSEKSFTVLEPNPIGGPYVFDTNTILLIHFDNGLENRAYASGDANGNTDNLQLETTRKVTFGNTLRTTSPISVNHTPSLNLSGDWTIEAWVKFNSFNPNYGMTIVTKPGDSDSYQSNYTLEINPWWGNVFHGFYFSEIDSRVGCSTFGPQLNEWYHVAFIRDTKKSEIRVIVHDKNREKLWGNTTKYTGTETLLNTRDLIIGQYFDGYIDELRISNVVRNFDYPTAPSTPNPENSANKVLLTKRLSWTNGLNTASVDLYLDTTNPPSKKVLENAVSTSSFSPSLLPNTTYYWQVVAKNELLSASGPVWSFTTDYATGLNSWSTDDLQIYPNPSGGVFQLKNSGDQYPFEMRVIDLNGKTVFRQIVPAAESPKFDLSGLPKGIYFVHFVREKQTKTVKIIFQ